MSFLFCMTHYLIEFRFHGSAKYEIKTLIDEINHKFEIKSKRAVPHITLVGPFSTDNEKRLIRDFNHLCSIKSLSEKSRCSKCYPCTCQM